ncbi:MAG: hypothetical protein V1875_02625 [Candidatus Altiarchaeota archaeon]
MKMRKTLLGLSAAAFFAQSVSATAPDAATIIRNIICTLIPEVINLSWALAVLVFVYGGAKYAHAADDPGGRKQGKSIALNAIIGFIIIAASKAVVEAIAFAGGTGNICPP